MTVLSANPGVKPIIDMYEASMIKFWIPWNTPWKKQHTFDSPDSFVGRSSASSAELQTNNQCLQQMVLKVVNVNQFDIKFDLDFFNLDPIRLRVTLSYRLIILWNMNSIRWTVHKITSRNYSNITFDTIDSVGDLEPITKLQLNLLLLQPIEYILRLNNSKT